MTKEQALKELQRCLPHGCTVRVETTRRVIFEEDGKIRPVEFDGQAYVVIHNGKSGDDEICQGGSGEDLRSAVLNALTKFNQLSRFKRFLREESESSAKVLETCVES
jgi:hypothetical protein